MSKTRQVVVFISSLALCACASTPPTSKSGKFDSALDICPGRVANAPVSTHGGQVKNYDPIAEVSGVLLARAPTSGCVSSGFGPRRGGAGRFHHGLDIFTPSPTPIYAGGEGVVEKVGAQRGYGRTIVIRHSARVKTLYAHLSTYARGISPGDRVQKGALIGYTGDSGNATAVHLHYEILVNDQARNPLTVGR